MTAIKTLADFRKTRVFTPDLRGVEGSGAVYELGLIDYPQPGFLYAGYLAIGIVTADWPADENERGPFHLLIGNGEWMGSDLAALEERLFRAMF